MSRREYTGILVGVDGEITTQTLTDFNKITMNGAITSGVALHKPLCGCGIAQTLFMDDIGKSKGLPQNLGATILYRAGRPGESNDGSVLRGPVLLVDDEHQFTSEDVEKVDHFIKKKIFKTTVDRLHAQKHFDALKRASCSYLHFRLHSKRLSRRHS